MVQFVVFQLMTLISLLELSSTEFLPTHSATLKDDVYYLYWKYSTDDITFEVKAKTTGYIGFGLSPNGGMKDSDMVIGWVKNGKPFFTDRFATGESEPIIDQSQDWKLLKADDNGTWTSIRFSRKLKTCDTSDREINEDTMRVVWAYHNDDPASETGLPQHTDRGVKSIQFLSYGVGINKPTMPNDIVIFDFLVSNVSVPSAETTYWCQTIKGPTFNKPHHIIKFEPIIKPGHEALVHHSILFACAIKRNHSYHEMSQDCTSWFSNMPQDTSCFTIMFAWAIGGGELYLPEHVTLPFPETTFLLEIHYDNPEMRSDFVDASGLRVTLTPTPREYEGGYMAVGDDFIGSESYVIPPGISSFTSFGTCIGQCTKEAMKDQPEGINIFSLFNHAHLLSRKIRLRHIRNGVELPLISYDNNYDFNYQETRQLKKETRVLPGDELRTECILDSTGRTNITLTGLGTKQEMCIIFFMYYPRINLTTCLSKNSPASYLSLIGDSVTSDSNITMLGLTQSKITSPKDYSGRTVYDALQKIDWTNQSNLRKLEQIIHTSPKQIRCNYGLEIFYPVHGITNYTLQPITTPLPNPVDTCIITTKSGTGGIKPCVCVLKFILALAFAFMN